MPQVERPPIGQPARRPISQEKLEALLALLKESSPGALSKNFMAQRLGITPRTVDGALNALVFDGANIQEEWALEGGRRVKTWTLLSGPSWDESIDSGARLALEVVLSALGSGLAGAWRNHLDEIQSLVEGKLTQRERSIFDQLKSKVVIHGVRQSQPPSPGVLHTVLGCLGGHPQKLRLRYSSAATGQEEAIEVVPWCLLHDVFSSGAFVLCWDYTRGNPSLLRLNRILQAESAGISSLLPSEKELLDRCSRYQIGGFISSEEPEEIQVRVSGKLWVRAFLEQPPGLPDVSVTAEAAGTALVRFWATDYKAPARWVLQMGSDAQVVAPAAFAEHVAHRAKATASLYPQFQ